MDTEFVEQNIIAVEMTMLLALGDLMMMQFMPWKVSDFFVLSEGYPSRGMMGLVLTIKTLQSLVTVVCEITYLGMTAGNGPARSSAEAQSLLYLNIVFGVGSVVYELVVVALRMGILDRWASRETGCACIGVGTECRRMRTERA